METFLQGKTFWECVCELRRRGLIPRVWKRANLRPYMEEPNGSGPFSPNSINTIPSNQSLTKDGTERGDYVKKGQRAYAYRLGDGWFELINDPETQVTDTLINNPSKESERSHKELPNISSPFDVDNIPRVLCRLKNNKGRLEDYNYLQQSLLKTNVADDRSYQRKFKSFYRVRRNDVWCAIFFQILEREKRNKTVSFSNVLNEIYREARHNDRQQVEMSFASKLVATINPELPVLDKYVFENLGLKTSSNRKLNRVVEIYSEVQTLTSRKIQSNGFETWRNRFDETFPQFTHFTDVKKLDLFLWQKR